MLARRGRDDCAAGSSPSQITASPSQVTKDYHGDTAMHSASGRGFFCVTNPRDLVGGVLRSSTIKIAAAQLADPDFKPAHTPCVDAERPVPRPLPPRLQAQRDVARLQRPLHGACPSRGTHGDLSAASRSAISASPNVAPKRAAATVGDILDRYLRRQRCQQQSGTPCTQEQRRYWLDARPGVDAQRPATASALGQLHCCTVSQQGPTSVRTHERRTLSWLRETPKMKPTRGFRVRQQRTAQHGRRWVTQHALQFAAPDWWTAETPNGRRRDHDRRAAVAVRRTRARSASPRRTGRVSGRKGGSGEWPAILVGHDYRGPPVGAAGPRRQPQTMAVQDQKMDSDSGGWQRTNRGAPSDRDRTSSTSLEDRMECMILCCCHVSLLADSAQTGGTVSELCLEVDILQAEAGGGGKPRRKKMLQGGWNQPQRMMRRKTTVTRGKH